MNWNSLFSLEGKTALITGGATGIGRMASEGLMAAGAHVLIASRKRDVCESAAEQLNGLGLAGTAEAFAGDVGSEVGVDALAQETACRIGNRIGNRGDKLDILVNNAGTSWGQPLGSFPHSAFERVMSVNVAGLFALTQALLPNLRASASDKDPARVINIGSVMGEMPLGDGAYSYAASKAAVHQLTKIMAKELAAERITVNALAPGPFVSNMTAFVTDDPKTRDVVGRNVPLGRVGSPEDIAGAVTYLSSRAGAYVTGAILPLSGGINVSTGPALFDEALAVKATL